MFVAHLPAGYLIGAPLSDRSGSSRRAVMAAALAGSVFPDVDLIRCYFVDRGHVAHHAYWTHLPFAWLVIALATVPLLTLLGAKRARATAVAFLAGVLSHLVLDSVAAGIEWLYPFDTRFYGLFHVPDTHAWWPMNFFLHWTFLFEISIVVFAVATYLHRARRARSRPIANDPIVIDPSRRYSDLLVIRGDGRDSSPAGIRLRP